MLKMKELAMENEDIAYALVGQAVLDEAKIGPDMIRISYYSEGEARYLWEVGRTEKAHGAKRWVFTIKASARRRLYEAIGPLPNSAKDRAFKHLVARDPKGGNRKYSRGEAKKAILNTLRMPRTVREICEHANLSSSSVRKHLRDLEKEGKVRKVGKNVNAIRKNYRLAELWLASES
ncbi:MAG: helix-turn-helix domain-containing protein [Candidatus Bathyarchaeia archaeon]|nr:helix-turn-helix domain-containing protein [Candidatus Bathyarchaeia archaeon]